MRFCVLSALVAFRSGAALRPSAAEDASENIGAHVKASGQQHLLDSQRTGPKETPQQVERHIEKVAQQELKAAEFFFDHVGEQPDAGTQKKSQKAGGQNSQRNEEHPETKDTSPLELVDAAERLEEDILDPQEDSKSKSNRSVYVDEEALEHAEARHLFQVLLACILPPVIAVPIYLVFLRYSHAAHESFGFGLFDCWGDALICGVACFCPAIRWADTLSKEKAGIMAFAVGFAIMLLLCTVRYLGVRGWWIGSIGIAIVGAVFRQMLRAEYGLAPWTIKTAVADVCVWFWFPTCAIIQEARQVEWMEEKVDRTVTASFPAFVAGAPLEAAGAGGSSTSKESPQEQAVGDGLQASSAPVPEVMAESCAQAERKASVVQQASAQELPAAEAAPSQGKEDQQTTAATPPAPLEKPDADS